MGDVLLRKKGGKQSGRCGVVVKGLFGRMGAVLLVGKMSVKTAGCVEKRYQVE
jgi:hypothetical protein